MFGKGGAKPLKNWSFVRQRTAKGAEGNSLGCENAMIHSQKCAHVLLPTGDVTLLPEVSAQGCRFNLKPQMFLGRV